MSTYLVLGVDEVGNGALAGPLVMGAVILDVDQRIEAVRDSKKMSAEQREAVVPRIVAEAKYWCLAATGPRLLDRLGVDQAWSWLGVHLVSRCWERFPDAKLYVDGARPFRGIPKLRQRCIVNGDTAVPSIAAASVLAKVARDSMMRRLAADPTYEPYGFETNMGYGTPTHLVALQAYGASPQHRRSYAPVARALAQRRDP